MRHRPAGEGVGGGARRDNPLRIGRRVAVAMGAVCADWSGRVSVVAGQIPGAGQVRGAGWGGRETPEVTRGSAPLSAAPLLPAPGTAGGSTWDAEGSRERAPFPRGILGNMDFAALGLCVSALGSFRTPPCPCRDARGSVARSEGRGSTAVWKSPVLLSFILPHSFNLFFF